VKETTYRTPNQDLYKLQCIDHLTQKIDSAGLQTANDSSQVLPSLVKALNMSPDAVILCYTLRNRCELSDLNAVVREREDFSIDTPKRIDTDNLASEAGYQTI
jgi:hypothetical protein